MQKKDKWRSSVDLEDPYELDAIYGAISKVTIGFKYPKKGVMELAMAYHNLKEGDYKEHEVEMVKIQHHLQECAPFMKRVKIIDLPFASPHRVNGSNSYYF